MITKIDQASIVSFDLIAENFDYKSGNIEGISFSTSKDSGWYVPLGSNQKNGDVFLDFLKNIFYDDKYYFCSQNIKQHMVLLFKNDIVFKSKFYDVTIDQFSNNN